MMLFDLTNTVGHNSNVYPGDPPVELFRCAQVATHGYANSIFKTGMHAGTHIDGPLHMLNNGCDIANTDLNKLIGNAKVIDARGIQTIDLTPAIKELDLYNKIVLFCTDFSLHCDEETYFTSHPILTISLAQHLIDQRIKMVAIDFPSPDMAPYDIHKLLLSNDIYIAENLTNVSILLPYKHIELYALPLKIQADSSPARIIAKVLDR